MLVWRDAVLEYAVTGLIPPGRVLSTKDKKVAQSPLPSGMWESQVARGSLWW